MPQNSPSCALDKTSNSSVTVSVEPSITQIRQKVAVSAGQGLAYNLALAEGSALYARFQVSGGLNNTIKVWLLDERNYQRYNAHQQFSYFTGTSGQIRGTGNYVFQVPATNLYYLVVDNSQAWVLPRDVQLYVYSVLPQHNSETIATEQTLNTAFGKLGELFVFPSFHISLKHCGVVNAFSNPDITICSELAETLAEQNLGDAISFVIFHELGHSLMRLWGLPSYDNEDVADEFATVFMVLGKQQKGALQAAQWWASQTSQQEALSKLWIDDRHTVSPQRARNIIHWLQQSDLLQRWFHVFVPHIQTGALSQMLGDSSLNVDKEQIRAELQRRGCTTQQVAKLLP